MKQRGKRLLLGCTLVALVVVSGAPVGHQQAIAQQSIPTLTSMYTGPDGLTHFKEIPFPKEPIKVSQIQFNDGRGRKPNPSTLAFHTAPAFRRYIVTLSGRAEIVGSGGAKFTADRDHILLAEDTTGKGHTTNGIDWVTIFVEIGDPQASRPAQPSN